MVAIGVLSTVGIRGFPNITINGVTVPASTRHGFNQQTSIIPAIGVMDLPLDTPLEVVSMYNEGLNVDQASNTFWLFNIDYLESIGQSMTAIQNIYWDFLNGRTQSPNLGNNITSFSTKYTIGHLWRLKSKDHRIALNSNYDNPIKDYWNAKRAEAKQKWPEQTFTNEFGYETTYLTQSQLNSIDTNNWLELQIAGRQIPQSFNINLSSTKYNNQKPVIRADQLTETEIFNAMSTFANDTTQDIDLRNDVKLLLESAGRNDITWVEAWNQFLNIIEGAGIDDIQVIIDTTVESGQSPLSVVFTADISGGLSPYVVEWNMDDGTILNGLSVVHQFSEGIFNVKVKVTDVLKNQSTTSKIIESIAEPLPEPTPTPEPDPTPEPTPEPDPIPDPTPEPTPTPEPQEGLSNTEKALIGGGAAIGIGTALAILFSRKK